jgi:hypothetical protein
MVPADQPEPDFTPLPVDARMDGYYIGFDRTGCDPVDAILSAVAIAGKGSHSTDGWNDESAYYANRPGLPDVGPEATANELIQKTAERSAREITAHAARPAAPTAPATPPVGAGTSEGAAGPQIGAGELGLGAALRAMAAVTPHGTREGVLRDFADRADALERTVQAVRAARRDLRHNHAHMAPGRWDKDGSICDVCVRVDAMDAALDGTQ